MKELRDIVAAFEPIKRCGKTAAIATIVNVSGSTYRRPGARMLMTSDRVMTGSISGGCLENDVLEHALEVMNSGKPTLVTYDTNSDDDLIWGLGLGCNGIVQVLIECLKPESALSPIAFLAKCLGDRSSGVLATVFRTESTLSEQSTMGKVGTYLTLSSDGTVESNIQDSKLTKDILADAQAALTSSQSTVKVYQFLTGSVEVFIEAIQPPVSLVVFGAGHDALPVVRLAKELGWYVTVVDSRPAYATSDRVPLADAIVLSRPESVCEQIRVDSQTVAVVMTHNYHHDLELLKTLLPFGLPYLGVLGPKNRTERLLQEILAQGITPTKAQLSRLYAPIGVDIGADTPEEIALAIIAEIKAVLTNRAGGFLRERKEPIHARTSEWKVAQTAI